MFRLILEALPSADDFDLLTVAAIATVISMALLTYVAPRIQKHQVERRIRQATRRITL